MKPLEYILPAADWRIVLDGIDLSPRFKPVLVSLQLREARGEEADQLDITLNDTDGRLAIPNQDAILTLQLGWARGSNVPIGLVDKGRFNVDEISHSGPPDQLVIRARAADFTDALGQRRERSWTDTTLGAIIGQLASANKLEAKISPALASVEIASLTQRESDIALLRRLGREHDAVASIKAGRLIFSAIGAGVSTSGKSLPTLALTRASGDRHTYSVAKRDDHKGVIAKWHDKAAAEQKKVVEGAEEGAKTLSRVYGSESEARRAAKAEMGRIGRAPVKLSLTLAYGRADVGPEQRVKALGFKSEVDAVSWLVTEVTHKLDSGGFTTDLQMERS